MAKNYSNKKGSASLIFTWILIILLAIGSFMVLENYNDNHTNLVKNKEIVQLLAEKTGKDVGDITKEDLSSIEMISIYPQLDYMQLIQADGTLSISPDQELPYVNYVSLGLKGYLDATDNETAENLVVTYPGDINSIKDDLALFTGIKSFELIDYTGAMPEFDLKTLSADTFKNIEYLTLEGYNVSSFASIADHKLLKGVSLSGINDEDLAIVKNITTLETLFVAGEKITDASAVEEITTLKNLAITGTSIKNIPSLEKLVNLETVDFSDNNLTDISPLSALNAEKITKVSITGNAIEDFSPISHIDEKKITKDEPEEESTDETTESESIDSETISVE